MALPNSLKQLQVCAGAPSKTCALQSVAASQWHFFLLCRGVTDCRIQPTENKQSCFIQTPSPELLVTQMLTLGKNKSSLKRQSFWCEPRWCCPSHQHRLGDLRRSVGDLQLKLTGVRREAVRNLASKAGSALQVWAASEQKTGWF